MHLMWITLAWNFIEKNAGVGIQPQIQDVLEMKVSVIPYAVEMAMKDAAVVGELQFLLQEYQVLPYFTFS